MKLFLVALAYLLSGNNAVQLEQSPINSNLLEPIAHMDENKLNLEKNNDVNALDQYGSSEAAANDHSTYIIGSVISTIIRNQINSAIRSIPEVYEFQNNFLSIKKNERGFAAHTDDVELRGFNNINIDNINVNFWGTKAIITLSLPKVEVHCGNVGLDVSVSGSKLSAWKTGSVSVSNIVITINAVVNPIRFTITDVEVSITSVGPVESNLSVQLLGADVSQAVNDLIENIVPTVLDGYKGKLETILQDEYVLYHDLSEPLA